MSEEKQEKKAENKISEKTEKKLEDKTSKKTEKKADKKNVKKPEKKQATKPLDKQNTEPEKKPTKKESDKGEKVKEKLSFKKEETEKIKLSKRQIQLIVAIVLALILIIIIAVIFTEEKTGDKREKIKGDSIGVSVSYPKEQGFEYKVIDSAELQTSEIIKEGEDFVIDIIIDNKTLKNNYRGDFIEYKEVKTAGVESEDITIDGITGFGFYNKNEDKYQIILPYDSTQTVNIEVKPIVRFTGDNGETLFKRDDVRKIIDSIKINNR